MKKQVAIIGSGPAGLMAADVLASQNYKVCIYEKRKRAAWKLYVAGSSGLNITNSLDISTFLSHYTGPQEFWKKCLENFSPQDWIQFIEKKLGLGTFLGTSGRYFVETMHAAKLIRVWKKRLEDLGVQFFFDHECVDFKIKKTSEIELFFSNQFSHTYHSAYFALGGASWEKEFIKWPSMFISKGIQFTEFKASNTGYEVEWQEDFLKESEGKPLKNILFKSSRGERKGDLVVTSYGLEGTPIYFFGECGVVDIDLKPDLSEEEIYKKLSSSKENLSAMRRVKKYLNLCEASLSLLFHYASTKDLKELSHFIKNFPLRLKQPRPLSESISSQGGIAWSEVDEHLMLHKFPNVYCLGEMLDWDAPTGGFLIQACVSQGAWVTQNLSQFC